MKRNDCIVVEDVEEPEVLARNAANPRRPSRRNTRFNVQWAWQRLRFAKRALGRRKEAGNDGACDHPGSLERESVLGTQR